MNSVTTTQTNSLARVQTSRTGGPQGHSGVANFVSQRADQVMGKNEFSQGGLGLFTEEKPAVLKSGIGEAAAKIAAAAREKAAAAAAPKHLNSYDTNLKTNNADRLDPSTKESRLKDLNGFSQRDNDDMGTLADKERCAATSLTAAAYHANGTKGLSELMKSSEAFAKKHDMEPPDYSAIKAKIQKGEPLTKGDLGYIADNLHTTLKDADYEGGGRTGAGVSPGGLNTFLKSEGSTGLAKMLKDNGSGVEPVDANGDGQFDHWVARLGNGQGTPTIYDPESIKGPDGQLKQLTSDQAGVERYADSVRRAKQHINTGQPQPPKG